MHQIGPAPSNKAPTRYGLSSPFQQAAPTEHFDAFTLLEDDLDAVACEACQVAAKGAGAGFAGVLQYRADEDAFVLQAGIGWPARMVGRARVAADLGTTAGLAWITGQLLHFRELGVIGRVRVPEALVRQGVQRMVSVPIHGGHKEAFEVLEVGATDAGEFMPGDLAFLQKTADSVAAAVGLHASRAGRREQTELFAGRQVALAGRPGTAPGRQGPAGTSYQQDGQCGAG